MRKKLYFYVSSTIIILSLSISGCALKSVSTAGTVQTGSTVKSQDKTVAYVDTEQPDSAVNEVSQMQQNVDNEHGNPVATPEPPGYGELNDTKTGTSQVVVDKPLAPKEVFLTFDDGPSVNTQKILKILNDKGVKASFFVLGRNAERYPDLIKAENEAGMAILNHSYSHDYSMYKSVDICMEDFSKSEKILNEILGTHSSNFIRFPGGSDNKVSNANTMKDIRDTFVSKGMAYVDWNISSADAAAALVPSETIKSNVINQLSHKSFGVVLMHDAGAKTTTVDALPEIVDHLIAQGFVFRTFNDLTPAEEKEMIKTRIVDRGASERLAHP
ncbi:MAG: polysaccharide deacetylase family protein [Bacillota bacterium]|nr:polysaccharide deacetylase family protein [Bacillota bacterium]